MLPRKLPEIFRVCGFEILGFRVLGFGALVIGFWWSRVCKGFLGLGL